MNPRRNPEAPPPAGIAPTRFYLGTHHPDWLERTSVPLFVSNRTLYKRKGFPRARGPWALDSGGFSELDMYGAWQTSKEEYVHNVRLYQREIGRMEWCAPQDWMCEPHILAKTKLSVKEHQLRTVRSVLDLRSAGLPVIPVLQGWTTGDYMDCQELYAHVGIDLRREPLVGIGSVCRRQSTMRSTVLLQEFTTQGIRLHGFGFKITGLKSSADVSETLGRGFTLASADSLAWSMRAFYDDPLPGHEAMHKHCNNCIDYALQWRRDLLRSGRGWIV